jgi:hypothetical protein
MRTLSWTAVAFALATQVAHAQAPAAPNEDPLFQKVSALDTAFFGSFNACTDPEQLKKHEALIDPRLEFYHDNGGVTWTRKDYLDKTRQNVCGRFRRNLKPGSLNVYPIKGFGAIEEGDQTFCEFASGKCFGEARFMIVWRQDGDTWQATRIFSYGHHAL